jgi:Putative beta-barrel porin-2, OmpL-like. bbp2
VTYKPVPGLELVADSMAGLEREPVPLTGALPLAVPPLAFRAVFDGYARYEVGEHLAFAVTGDYGRDASGGGVSFWGVGGYARVEITSWLAAALRGEYYDDADAFTSGERQRLVEGTATLEVHGHIDSVKWRARLEGRRDQSDVGRTNHQDTLGLSLVSWF